MTPLLRFWFTFEAPVSPRAYLRHGLALMAAKFAGDFALVRLVTGQVWTPLDYLRSVSLLVSNRFEGAPSWLAPAMAIWALPFIWIGVTLTLRRTLDAGASAWSSLLFFVPYFNYLWMIALCRMPSAPITEGAAAEWRPSDRTLPEALMAMGAGLGLGLCMLAISVTVLRSYGSSLFLGTPFLIGVVTAFLFNRRHPSGIRDTLQVVMMTLALTLGVVFLLGREGAICLAMTLPLSLPLGAMGGVLGRRFALSDPGSLRAAALVVLALPLSAVVAPKDAAPVLREVITMVNITASPEVVWRNVIAFPPMATPTDLAFRAGIAWPRSARLVGKGVGAVRYCEFSTGAFVEPVTAWEPGRLLSFDVASSPPPMREWSIYASVTPPHLDGYFESRRGEFRLIPLPDGTTRLEGSTWYQLRIHPEEYWALFSDQLIHAIHRRVLAHIKATAERR